MSDSNDYNTNRLSPQGSANKISILSREDIDRAMENDDTSILNNLEQEIEREREEREEEEEDNNSYRHVLLDDEEEEEFENFVMKYGDIKVRYIKKPKFNTWWLSKPYALNFFYNGTLYRTNGERGESSKIELFLDLMYVGIVAKLASSATENASGLSLLKYILLFLPVWQIWADIKDFMNYYYNDDLSQKLYMVWILCLLTIYVNSTDYLLDSNLKTSSVIIPYILCRLSLSISEWVYSFFIPQHRFQMRLYGTLIFITSMLWIIVIFINTRAKIGLSFTLIFLEHFSTWFTFHPFIKKKLNLKYSTALNIEHEVERFGAFYVIAIGEFLYKIVANKESLGSGLSKRIGRALMLLIIAFNLMWLYFNGDGSKKAIHAIRRDANTALFWLETHPFLIASLILSADAAGDLCSFKDEYTGKPKQHESSLIERATTSEEEEINRYALTLMFTGGLCVSLLCLTLLAYLDKSLDDSKKFLISKKIRLIPRIPIAIIILCLAFAELKITKLFAIIMCLLLLLTIFELYIAATACENDNDNENENHNHNN